MAIREDLPTLLGVKWETSDSFDAVAKTPIGVAILGSCSSGRFVCLDVGNEWMEVNRGGGVKGCIRKADRRLRALLAAAVEPIAAKLEADSYELHGRFATVEIAAAERAANLVRSFYAEEPSR
jgi:hypothetical protein